MTGEKGNAGNEFNGRGDYELQQLTLTLSLSRLRLRLPVGAGAMPMPVPHPRVSFSPATGSHSCPLFATVGTHSLWHSRSPC